MHWVAKTPNTELYMEEKPERREEKRETRRGLQHPERKASGDISTYFRGEKGTGGVFFFILNRN